MRTDPRNTAYVVIRGGRKRDTGDDTNENNKDDSLVKTGEALLADPKEIQDQRETAFSNLEKTIKDRATLAAAAQRIDELEDAAARDWDDPYARNAALRRAFRVGRKEREKQAGVDAGIKERLGLAGIELLPESEEDARRARLVDFGTGPPHTGEEKVEEEKRVLATPLFGSERVAGKKMTGTSQRGGLKSERVASNRKTALVSEIVGNTRIALDPFLERKGGKSAPAAGAFADALPGLKRKRGVGEKEQSPEKPTAKAPAVLVDYDSE